ncbi:MAG: hypothetical protein JNK05_31950 [Myxococcales bacterium]|nr:hypothetical protein [Myxococcales bacterium]
MIAVSEPWVTAGEVRKRIEQYEPLRGRLPVVKRAHDAVFALTTRKVAAEAGAADGARPCEMGSVNWVVEGQRPCGCGARTARG